ncbi:MAG: hypothetical protein ACYDBV_04805 [Nitrospiria bacterium]
MSNEHKNVTSKAKFLLFFACYWLLISGCGSSQEYIVSVPKNERADLTIGRSHIVELNLPGIKLSVIPFNARLNSTWNTVITIVPLPIDLGYPEAKRFSKHQEYAAPPFIIEMALETTDADVTINPSEVVLHEAGKDVRPIGMVFPSELLVTMKPLPAISRCHRLGNLSAKEGFMPLKETKVAAGKTACVWLSYDIAVPPPESGFSMSIQGIQRAGSIVEIPSIIFGPAIGYSTGSIP